MMARMSCTFCRIIAGDLPSTRLADDDTCLVLLDRNQAARGHLLVIPRAHVTRFHELDAQVAGRVMHHVHAWAGALAAALRPEGYNILVNNGAAAGQDIDHVHVHVVPRSAGDGYYAFGGNHATLSDAEVAALADDLRRHATG